VTDFGVRRCGLDVRRDEIDGISVVRVVDWDQFAWLRHGFSTRIGGVSKAYGVDPQGGGSLNLGWTKEDDPAAVLENRRRFVRGFRGEDAGVLVGVRQVHSDLVHVVRRSDGALEGRLVTGDGKAMWEGDGLMTDVPGVLLGVGTADCVPVLVVDVEKRVVAAFHAGWRGTVARIVELGVAKMREEYGSRVEDLVAAVGPSIGACCYSVGDEVREKFGREFKYGEELFRVGSEDDLEGMYLDLWEANLRQLQDAGLTERQITMVGECTACSWEESGGLRYFSHRGEMGVAGRMLNVVGVVG
jgi:polyphenol oxidase